MNLKQVEWKTVGKAVLKEYSKDDIPGLSAELAYHFIFALFPFAIFLASLAGFIGHLIGSDKLMDQIMGSLYSALPQSSAESLSKPLGDVLKAQRGGALSVGAILALWSASNGVGTVMKAFNRAYGVEETRNFLVKKGLAVGMTLVLSLLLVGGFVLLAFGGQIGEWVANGFGLGGLFKVTWNIVRIIGSLFGISLALALLYWKGPNVKQQFHFLTPGSVITTIALAIGTVAFGLYVQFMGASSYSKTYGAAFGFILFLLFLYYASSIILLGAELNAETAKRYDEELIRDKMAEPEKQLPGEQPAPDPRAARKAGVTPQQVVASNAASAGKIASGRSSAASATAAHAAEHGGTTEADAADEREPELTGARRHLALVDTGSGPGPKLASEAEPGHKDHTTLVTAAVSAAAVAGAVALGALTHKDEDKKAA